MSNSTGDTTSTAPAMDRFWIPSNAQMKQRGFPDKYLLHQTVETLYRQLPKAYQTIFDSFGTGAAVPPPLQSDPPGLAALESGSASAHANETGSATSDYLEAAISLQQSFRKLKLADADIPALAKKSKTISQNAQEAINGIIATIREKAKMPSPTTTDEWVQKFLADAMDDVTASISTAKNQYELVGKVVDDTTGKVSPETDARIKALEDRLGLANPPATTNNDWPGGWNGGLNGLPPYTGMPGTIPGSPAGTPDPTLPPKVDTTTPPKTSDDELLKQIRSIGQPSDVTPPTPASNLNPNLTTPAYTSGSPMDMSSSLWPLMSMLQPNNYDRQMADPGRYDRYDEDPYNQYPQYGGMPMQASPAAVTQQTPATTPPAATPPPATTDKPATPAPATTVAPHTPDSDGGVDYPFPDGKTQRVSVIVAKALDKAFGNKKGTDAQAAYADTTAKWSDTKQIGDRVDPSQLMTGDVGIWESPDLVAIVRAMGSEAEASLDLIVNGELRRYPDQISETTGELGKFVGWAHPRGIEITGTSAKHGDVPVPGIATPAAPLPTIAAPAS